MPSDVVQANGMEPRLDAFGDRADPAIVLVMGLATQRLAWSDEFCAELRRPRDASSSASTTAGRG